MIEPVERKRAQAPARLLLLVLIVAAPLVFAAKVALGELRTRPDPQAPTWTQTVLVTVGRWPSPNELPPGPGFRELESRGVKIGPIFTAALSAPGPSAVSLLTGRYVANHGVRTQTDALPSAAWTLASAARDSGARTGAFLSVPFVSRHGLAGFEQLVEAPASSPAELTRAAADFLIEHRSERRFVWIHLDRPGTNGGDVESALETVRETFDELEQRHESLIIFTALSGPPDAPAEGRSRVPMWVELPAGLNAGMEATSQLSHVDLAGALTRLMRLPWPNPGFEQSPLQSRTQSMVGAMSGGQSVEWIWIDTEDGDLLRTPIQGGRGLRVRSTRLEAGGTPTYDMRVLEVGPQSPDQLQPVPAEDEGAATELYISIRGQVLRGATKPVPVR